MAVETFYWLCIPPTSHYNLIYLLAVVDLVTATKGHFFLYYIYEMRAGKPLLR